MITSLTFLALVGPLALVPAEDPRSSPDHVDPWDVVPDHGQLHILDKTLRLAQRDMKYFQEDVEPWRKKYFEPGEDHITGFNSTDFSKTHIPPPKGFGDKQALEMMKTMTVPEFDITKLKLKVDKKNNESVIFGVVMKPGAENKILGYSSKRLHVQIHAPNFKGAADNELGRYLAKILCVPRNLLKIKQGAGQHIRKVRMPKAALQQNVYIRKLVKEFGLETATRKSAEASQYET